MLFKEKEVSNEEVKKVNNKIDDIKLQIKIIDEKLDKFVIFRQMLDDYRFDNNTKERAKDIFEKLEYLKGEYLKELEESENSLKDLICTCQHDMEFIWADSHHDYYKCTKCGFEERI